jgi:hypothetical protein
MARACITASIFCFSNAMAYKANGINMFIGWWRGLNQKQLSSANIYFICRQNAFGLPNLQEPLFYGWIHDDESDNAQMNIVR